MVHAVEEIWRVLADGGRMIDFRPIGAHWPMQVVVGKRVFRAGLVDRSSTIRSDAICRNALSQVVERGLFSVERNKTLYHCEYGDTPAEVRAPCDLPEAVEKSALRLMEEVGEGALVRVRIRNEITRYRKLPSGRMRQEGT